MFDDKRLPRQIAMDEGDLSRFHDQLGELRSRLLGADSALVKQGIIKAINQIFMDGRFDNLLSVNTTTKKSHQIKMESIRRVFAMMFESCSQQLLIAQKREVPFDQAEHLQTKKNAFLALNAAIECSAIWLEAQINQPEIQEIFSIIFNKTYLPAAYLEQVINPVSLVISAVAKIPTDDELKSEKVAAYIFLITRLGSLYYLYPYEESLTIEVSMREQLMSAYMAGISQANALSEKTREEETSASSQP